MSEVLKPWEKTGTGVVNTEQAAATTEIPPAIPMEVASERNLTPNTPKIRRARFRITRVDPWSVMKTSLLFSVSFAVITWVAVYIIWTVIGASGVLESLNQALTDVLSSPNDPKPSLLKDLLSINKVMGVTTLVVIANTIIFTALATLFAFLYNLSANIFDGLEVTLAED